MEAAFDTLAWAERLKAAGIENAHANALTDALRVALGEGVATKPDIREVRRELGADITGLANRIDGLDKRMDVIDKRMDVIEENMATKTELARVEMRLHRSINRVVFAIVGLIIALAAAIIAAIGLM